MDPEVLNEKSRYFPKLSVTTINPLREEDSGPKAHSHKNSNKKVIFTKAKGSVGLGPMCEKKKDVMGQNEINIIISNRFDVFWRNGPGMSTVSKGSHKSRPLNNNVLMKGDCETLNEGNQNGCTEKDKF